MSTPEKPGTELPVLLFEGPDQWAAWLDQHHTTSRGLWLRLAKKESGIRSVTYPEALDVALCYGWIDGQKQRGDDTTWLQKFTPRGPKSIWSKINREKVGVLEREGRMKPAGLAQVERARQDGRWDAAYEGQRTMTVPEDFQLELDRNPEAKAFFATLNGANRYALLFRIQTAKKPETRAKRIRQFIGMLEKRELFHPPAGGKKEG